MVLACILASVWWAVFWRRRLAPDMTSLLAQLDKPFRAYLHMPNVGTEMQVRRELDNALWRNIDGWRGLRRIYRNSGVLLTIRLRLENEISGAGGERYHIECDEAFLLRLTLLGCILEHLMIRKFPRLPIQRFYLRSALDQYIEFRSYLRGALECARPDLLEQFDLVA